MQKRTEYKFQTEQEAQTFADRQRGHQTPDEDKIVRGPFYMDEDEILRNMIWASTGLKWWQVNVEISR